MFTPSALFYIALTALVVGILLWFLFSPRVPARTVWGFALTAPLFFTLCVMLLSQEKARAALNPNDMLPIVAEIETDRENYSVQLSYIEAACLKRAVILNSAINIERVGQDPVPLRADSKVSGDLPSQQAVDAWGVLGKLSCPRFKALVKQHK